MSQGVKGEKLAKNCAEEMGKKDAKTEYGHFFL